MNMPFAPGWALLSSRGPLCQRCLKSHIRSLPFAQMRRSIGTKYLAKMAAAEEEWQRRAQRIEAGEERALWDILEERGFVKDTAGSKETIRELMRTKRIGAYVGIDPTASSLHIGHLLPLMPLFWMYMHGYWSYSLIGGATAKVGDPTGRIESRSRISRADMTMNMTKIHVQLRKLWASVDVQARRFGYERKHAWRRGIMNNNAWWNKEPLLEVLQRIGHSLRMGPMLSRDSVKLRMEQGDGMSFAEFTYPIMQGWDWWKMFSSPLKIQMQIGGSDQYGNIVSGIEIIKAARANEPNPLVALPANSPLDDPVGFTVPILTDKSGKKFGKSAGNAVWLDPYQTSTFDLYGYFVRRPDDAVETLLKLFTFHPLERIQAIMEEHSADPSKRVAQHLLAYEVLTLIHGEEEAKKIQEQHREVYAKGNDALISTGTTGDGAAAADQFQANEKRPTTPFNAPRIDLKLPESLIMGRSIARILYAARLCGSVSEGNRLAATQGAYVGGSPGQKPAVNKGMTFGSLEFTPVKLWFPQETKNFLIDGKLLILRKGKHNIRVIEMVSDEEYAALGETYPGQPYTGSVRKLREYLKTLREGGDVPVEELDRLNESKEGGEQQSSQLVFPEDEPNTQHRLEERLKAEIRKEVQKRKSLMGGTRQDSPNQDGN